MPVLTQEQLIVFWAIFTINGFLVIVGAISTLRWIGNRFRGRRNAARFRRQLRLAAPVLYPPRGEHFGARAGQAGTPAAGAPSAHPMRLDKGPRDWDQKLTND